MSTGAWAWIKGDREDHNNTTCPSGPGGTGPPPNASLGGRMGCAAAPLYGLEFEARFRPCHAELVRIPKFGTGLGSCCGGLGSQASTPLHPTLRHNFLSTKALVAFWHLVAVVGWYLRVSSSVAVASSLAEKKRKRKAAGRCCLLVLAGLCELRRSCARCVVSVCSLLNRRGPGVGAVCAGGGAGGE
jgi:hypothetical protein